MDYYKLRPQYGEEIRMLKELEGDWYDSSKEIEPSYGVVLS